MQKNRRARRNIERLDEARTRDGDDRITGLQRRVRQSVLLVAEHQGQWLFGSLHGLKRKPEPIRVVRLGLARALPAGKSLRNLAGALDERLHHRTQGPISQRHNRHRGLNGQVDWELHERMGSAVDLQD